MRREVKEREGKGYEENGAGGKRRDGKEGTGGMGSKEKEREWKGR